MKKKLLLLVMTGCLTLMQVVFQDYAASKELENLRLVSENTSTGFSYPESVAYDANENVLYVGQFGSEMKPSLKDGMGKISKVSLKGEILEEKFLPAKGDILNKPKGIWVEGDKLWVTDIDVVWVFDLETRQGKKVALPGVKFANDPTVMENALFVSDTAGKQIFKIEPADFLVIGESPRITVPFADLDFSPNGLYPSPGGILFVVGYDFSGQDQGIFTLNQSGKMETLGEKLGLLDGIVRLDDSTLLITDWKSKSLLRRHPDYSTEKLLQGFAGPADFCVVPEESGFVVIVPDLVKGELRMGHFRR